jgi:hypothetical protein
MGRLRRLQGNDGVLHSPVFMFTNWPRILAHTFRGCTLKSLMGLEDERRSLATGSIFTLFMVFSLTLFKAALESRFNSTFPQWKAIPYFGA